MRKIILDEDRDAIEFSDIDERRPIFAKRDDELSGMIVKEDEGWILRIGYRNGATGHHDTLRKCIENCLQHNYEFYIA